MRSLYRKCAKTFLFSNSGFPTLLKKCRHINTCGVSVKNAPSWSWDCNMRNVHLLCFHPARLNYRWYTASSGRTSRYSQIKKEQNDGSSGQMDQEHNILMHRLSAENDMLSRCRNTYIMTLVSIAAMQLEFSPLPATVGAVVIVTSELNLVLATILYVGTLVHNWRMGMVSSLMCTAGLLFAVVHFVLWTLVLALLFPDGKIIDSELKRYIGEDEDFRIPDK